MGTVNAVKVNAKVYSDDQKLYEGMTVRDAGKDIKQMQIFNSADIDYDGKINSLELSRYNGPIISAGGGELYPGLKLENANVSLRENFVRLDKDKDGLLSKAEMTEGAEANGILDKLKKIVSNAREAKDNLEKANGVLEFNRMNFLFFGIPVTILGGFIGCFLGVICPPVSTYIGLTLGALAAGYKPAKSWIYEPYKKYKQAKQDNENAQANLAQAQEYKNKLNETEYGQHILEKYTKEDEIYEKMKKTPEE